MRSTAERSGRVRYGAFLVGLALNLTGCASQQGDFSWITHTWTTDHGVYALDHISRKKVDVTTAVQRRLLGETYYFEDESNARVFDANPWAYLYCDNVRAQGRPDRTDQN
jgi:YHS domain-containing protein